MSMPSRRNIANKVEQLEEKSGHTPGDTIVMDLASINQSGQWPTKEEAKYPELVVKPHPERTPKVWDYAIPYHIPDRFLQESFLIVCAEESNDKYRLDDDKSGTVMVRTLWDSLSEQTLGKEYEYRKENEQPIPDILSAYE